MCRAANRMALALTAALAVAAAPALAGGGPPLDDPTLAAAVAEPGAVLTGTGLVYLTLKEGDGPNPTLYDGVRVHYVGRLADGTEFDSSYARSEPAQLAVAGVIRCWREGLPRMKVGGKTKFTCPPWLAYGPRGVGDMIPPNATLIFEVELLGLLGY
jgi:FKBP-type peptidyl-prolyl cis-trans isomerase FkpA